MAVISSKHASHPPRVAPADLERILRLRVPVIVKLAERKISVQEVLRLSNGAIIEFHKSSDDPLELLINNKPIGLGMAVKVGENFGIRLTQVGEVRQLVQALGK
jgi:flagellar motor switch protein FliN